MTMQPPDGVIAKLVEPSTGISRVMGLRFLCATTPLRPTDVLHAEVVFAVLKMTACHGQLTVLL